MRSLVIIGAGGFGRAVADVVDAINRIEPIYELLGFVDDGRPDDDVLLRRGSAVVGVSAALDAGLVPIMLLHPSVQIGADVRIGPGLVACGNTSVTTNVDLGRHVHLDRHVTVGHDTVVGDYVTVHPGATLSGSVTLGDGVRVGSNAVVIQGVTVGSGTTIGAGAAVVSDLPGGITAVGVPARPA